ncbi:MAG: GNAT family N-acetyltransferase [Chitinophagaceae bacterium]|nr:GNAT family N-acetyltransferase [Chitinophagaceae bacterium]
MKSQIDPDILEKWLQGWSLSREFPPPVKYRSGFKVEVGQPTQKARYVFPALTADLIKLSGTIDTPWVFLKACAPPKELMKAFPSKWILQPQGYFMTCFHPMNFRQGRLQSHYHFELKQYNSTFLITIVSDKGELASSGRVVLVDDLAVFDRISTTIDHQRKGLATQLMKELEKIALSNGITKNILVATDEGRQLYQSLGWDPYSYYSSVVIPLKD